MPRYDFLRFAAPFRTKNINFRAAVRAEPRAPANTRTSSPRCGEKSHRNARGSRIPPRRQSRKRAYPSAPASDRHAPPEPVQRPKKGSPSAAGNRAFCRRTRFSRRFGGRYNRLQRMPERKRNPNPSDGTGFYEAAFPVLPQPGPHFRSSSSTAPDGPERRLPDGPCTDPAEARSGGRRSPPLRCEQPRGRTRMKKEGEDSPNGILPRQTPAEPT